MTIQMEAIEQYFYCVLFIMLYKVVLTFNSVDKLLHIVCDIQMNAVEKYICAARFEKQNSPYLYSQFNGSFLE